MTIARTSENDTIMEQMLIQRGMILTCFAQIEWFLGKMLIEAHAHREYGDQDLSFSINIEKRIRLVRQLLKAEGPYHEFNERMTTILDQLEGYIELRNFMAHGVLISSFHETHGVVFRMRMFKAFKGGEEAEGIMDFSISKLVNETKSISDTAKNMIKIVRQIAQKHSLDIFYPSFDGSK